jgi:hypothetical protein
MKTMKISRITLDPRIQSRVAISQGTVDEYKQAYMDGDKFPPSIVFSDGKTNWLADGWHRLKAQSGLGFLDVEVEVREGGLRDAIKFSLSANSRHGLNRTNADKRKAVLAALDDEEWRELSAREIASLCAVSHTFVNQIYQERTAIEARKNGVIATPDEDESGNVSTTSTATPMERFDAPGPVETVANEPVPAPEPKPEPIPVIPAGMKLIEADAYEEMQENYRATLEDLDSLSAVMEADDQLGASKKEIQRLTARARTAEDRINALMREKNEAIRLVKARDKTIAQLQKRLKDLGVQEF